MNIRELKVLLRVGKNGLTEGVIEEVKQHLKKRKVVKIKFLKSFIDDHDRKKESLKLAELTASKVLELRGGVLILSK